MQVGIDVTYMCTDFGGHDLSGFGDTATLKNGQISLSDHGLQVIIKTFIKKEECRVAAIKTNTNKAV